MALALAYLSPIEKMWRILARRVYGNGVLRDSVESLNGAIDDVWETIQAIIFQSLTLSMQRRSISVIQN